MAKVTFTRNPIHTNGELPKVGSAAPDFSLTKTDLDNVSLAAYAGKKKLLNIFPSLDTGICAMSVKKFNEQAKKLNAALLMISADLPFAHNRFCTAEHTGDVVHLSSMHDRHFGKDYGVLMEDGPLAGLCARSVVVLDENNKVKYTELVPEIVQEPNYEAALAALK
ncbi:MAG: thiol peroxidase [Gammaproteobacteria bacterium]|nr:thiol peroxidase [Gammaproteobacteria bacterium]